ncbi:MAG: hypothetical protein CFE25_10600 [Chitinophagaceae bacterium BSSC1]|nr:MAG: hypothetical protein CFE25_10600 [Chitinophagaceae bacterium BSSC1]
MKRGPEVPFFISNPLKRELLNGGLARAQLYMLIATFLGRACKNFDSITSIAMKPMVAIVHMTTNDWCVQGPMT